MYAIIETGGKQVKVQVGDEIFIEKLPVEAGEKVTFDKVLLLGGDKTAKIGTPYVKGASVDASVIKQGKGEKIIVFRYGAKHNVRVKKGHRQPYTKVAINAING